MTLAGKNPLELPKRPSVILPSPGNEERFAFEALKQKAEKLIAHVEKKLDPYKSKKNEKRFDSAFSDLETAKEELAKAEEEIKEPVLPFFYGTLKIRNAIFSAIAALTDLKTATGGQIYRPTPESVKERGGILFSPFEKTIKSWEEHPRYETTPKGIIDYLKTINLPAGTNFKSVNARIANEKLLIDAVVGTRAGDAKFTAILENEPNGGLKVLSHKIDLPLLARGFRGQIEGYITNLNSAITGQINKTIDPNWEFRNISIGDDKLIFDFNKKAGAKPTPPTPDSTTTPSTVAGLSEEEEFTRRREKASPMIDRLTDEIFNKHQQRVPREKIRIVLESANSSWGYLLDEDSLRKVASTLETLADREGMDFSEMVNQFLEKMKKGEVKTPEATATPPPTEEQPPTAVGPSDEDKKRRTELAKEIAENSLKELETRVDEFERKYPEKEYLKEAPIVRASDTVKGTVRTAFEYAKQKFENGNHYLSGHNFDYAFIDFRWAYTMCKLTEKSIEAITQNRKIDAWEDVGEGRRLYDVLDEEFAELIKTGITPSTTTPTPTPEPTTPKVVAPIPSEIENEVIRRAISSAEEGKHSDEFAEELKKMLKVLQEKGFSENELTDLSSFAFATFLKNKVVLKELDRASYYQTQLLEIMKEIKARQDKGEPFTEELQRVDEYNKTIDYFIASIETNLKG